MIIFRNKRSSNYVKNCFFWLSLCNQIILPDKGKIFERTKWSSHLKYLCFSVHPSKILSILTIKPRRFLHLLNSTWLREESMSNVTEKLGIKIERNPSEEKLTQLGVRQWSKYILYSLFSTHFTLFLFFIFFYFLFFLRFCFFFTKKMSFTMIWCVCVYVPRFQHWRFFRFGPSKFKVLSPLVIWGDFGLLPSIVLNQKPLILQVNIY